MSGSVQPPSLKSVLIVSSSAPSLKSVPPSDTYTPNIESILSAQKSTNTQAISCCEMIHCNFILLFLFMSSMLTIVFISDSSLDSIMKTRVINRVELNTPAIIPPIFNDCIRVDNITNYFECPIRKNYYYYLNTLNTTYNFTCYWVKNNLAKSFWKCDETDEYENKHKLKHIAECAVIFSSGILLLRKAGKEIDSHTHVFRMNYPPLKGYEEFVGNKTTFHATHFSGGPFGPSYKIFAAAEKYPGIFDEYNSTIITYPDPKKTDIKSFYKNENRTKQLNLRWKLVDWYMPHVCNHAIHSRCTYGLFTLIYALQMCNDVDLYGFSDDKCLPLHYFDDDLAPVSLGPRSLKKECAKILYKQALIHNVQKEHNAINQMGMDFDNLHIVNYV